MQAFVARLSKTDLPVRTDVPKHPRDLLLEAHIEHPIRLVQHKVGDPSQVCDLATRDCQNIDEPPRRRHENLRPALELR